MPTEPILELSLVSLHSLDLIEIILLSRVSKSLWKAMRSLTEIRCAKAVSDDALQNSLCFFTGIKLLSINATYFTWRMMDRILDHPQVSLLRLGNLSLPEPSSEGFFSSIASTHSNSSNGSHYSSRWEHIRSIDLLNCESAGEAVEYLVGGCRNILQLSLHGSLYVKDRNVDLMLSGMQVLETLDFSQILGIQRLIITKTLQRSLKALRITKCSFLHDVILIQSPIGSLLSLTYCDFSSTAVNSECVNRTVLSCPQLKILILREVASITGRLTLLSQSLMHIDLQQSCSLNYLDLKCPNLSRLDVLGCLGLRGLTIISSRLRSLDLTMLSLLCSLEINCPCIKDIEFAGCRKLSKAKISARSPFSVSFSKKYYRSGNIREQHVIDDLDYTYFSCSELRTLPDFDPVTPFIAHPSHAKIRRNQFVRRSSSI